MERPLGCAQKNVLMPNATFDGEEDCLYLNIYRPAVRMNRINYLRRATQSIAHFRTEHIGEAKFIAASYCVHT